MAIGQCSDSNLADKLYDYKAYVYFYTMFHSHIRETMFM
jgi:hypothetical protein